MTTCLASTVHDGHTHACTIEPSPHPADVAHMAPCGKALHRWRDEETEPAAPRSVVCAPEATSHPPAVKLANIAGDNGWTTQLGAQGDAITLTLTRGDEHGTVLWTQNSEGSIRFTSCKIGGTRFGAREIAERLARAVPVERLATVTPLRPNPVVLGPQLTPAEVAQLAPPPPVNAVPQGGVMPMGTLATFMAAAPKALPINGNTPWANSYASELRDIIYWAGRNSPRNLQVHLGPSELGVPCDRQVAGKFAGLPATNHVTDPWPSILGTAGHAWLAEAFKSENARRGLRWVPENRVVPHPDHSGTADLYDGQEQAVVDWKILSADKIETIAAKGPSVQYQIQLLLYGLGYRNLGLPVRRVVLVALPRTRASLDTMYVWDHELTAADDLAIEEVWKLTAMRRQWADEILAGRDLMSVPATPDSDTCYYCPFYRPQAAEDGGSGCPGTKQH